MKVQRWPKRIREKKKILKKTVKNKEAKGSQESVVNEAEENLLAKKLDEFVLEGFHEGRSKSTWVSQKLIMKRLRSCIITWSKKPSQVKIFWQALAGWERSWTITFFIANKNMCGAKKFGSAYR